MGKARLFVAEKPSVARDLARVLGANGRERGAFCGDGILVTWCIGHVAELEEPQAYHPGWRVWRADQLPMLPERFKLRVNDATKDHWQLLAGWLNSAKVTQIVNACDAGREGELIFSYALELSGCKKPVLRLWLNAMTDAAVHNALRSMRPGANYRALEDAARCRAEADWLVGLNATRALTISQRGRGTDNTLYTVGRVQTPTLAMLVAREEAIEAFKPEPYWQVQCTVQAASSAPPPQDSSQNPGEACGERPDAANSAFAALYSHEVEVDGKQQQTHRLRTLEAAQKIQVAVLQQQGVISAVTHKVHHEPPPLLHDLTGLQRLANVRHGLSAQQTLQAAQNLYEKHKAITYPRTDSNYLPQTLAASLTPLLSRLQQGSLGHLVQPIVASIKRSNLQRIIQDSEVSDHHAIIPTGKTPPPMGTSAEERQIYELVLRRFIAAFYPPAKISTGTLTATIAGHAFVGRGRMVQEPGWHVVEPPLTSNKNDALLPIYHKHDPVKIIKSTVDSLCTRPPPRLSEATLLGAMERADVNSQEREVRMALKEQGLGTPATRAAVIENLKRRKYVLTQGRQLMPSAEGRALLQALPSAALKSAELTGVWEAKLAQMAKGKYSRTTFMQDIHAFVGMTVQDILKSTPPHSTNCAPAKRPAKVAAATLEQKKSAPHCCPVCGAKQVKKNGILTCSQGRSCTFAIFPEVAGRVLQEQELQILLQGARTPLLKGFVSRSGKAFAAHLELNAQGRVAFVFPKSS